MVAPSDVNLTLWFQQAVDPIYRGSFPLSDASGSFVPTESYDFEAGVLGASDNSAWTDSGGLNSLVSDTQINGGTKSLSYTTTAGASNTNDHGAWHTLDQAVTKDDELWWKCDMFFPTGWQFGTGGLKVMRIHVRETGGANHGFMDLYLNTDGTMYHQTENWGGTGGDPQKAINFLGVANDSQTNDVFPLEISPFIYANSNEVLTRDAWITMEVYVYASEVEDVAIWRCWINEVLALDIRIPTLLHATDELSELLHFTFWNNSNGTTEPPAQTCYVDNIEITYGNNPPTNTDISGNKMIGSTQLGFAIFSDVDYPAIPVYSEVGNVFFDSNATGANDGTSWADAYTGELAALTDLCSNAAGSSLTCRGLFDISTGIVLNGLGGVGNINNFYKFRADPVQGCNITASSINGLEFGGQTHWIIYGFNVVGGSKIFSYYSGGGSAGGTDHLCFRDLTGTMDAGGDNVGVVYMDTGSDYIGVFNCNLVGPGTGVHGNTAVVLFSRVPHFRVMNNELSNAPRVFYHKHSFDAINAGPNTQWFENNYIPNGTQVKMSASDVSIRNNIIRIPFEFMNDSGGDSGVDDNDVQFNIFEEVDFSILDNFAQNNTIRNNIITNRLDILRFQTAVASTNNSDYNLIGNGGIYYQNTVYTLANWQPILIQDTNSLTGAPTFLGGANPSTIAGFALNGGLGVGVASDGSDMGPDVGVVGTFPTAVSALPSIFSDTFERVSIPAFSQNGVSYDGDPFRTVISTTDPIEGLRSLEMESPAGTGDTGSQQNMFLPEMSEIDFTIDLKIPSNYAHRTFQGIDNNKITAIYSAPYGSPGFQLNFTLLPDGNGESGISLFSYSDGVENANTTPIAGFVNSNDFDNIITMRIYVKPSTTLTSSDGIAQVYKNGVIFFDRRDLDIWGGYGRNLIDELYFMGSATSGYAAITTFRVDNLAIRGTLIEAPTYSAFLAASLENGTNATQINETDLTLSLTNAEHTNDIVGPFGDAITGKFNGRTVSNSFGGGFNNDLGQVTPNGSNMWFRAYFYFPTAFCAGYQTGGDGYGSTKWLRLGYADNGQRITLQLSGFQGGVCSSNTLNFNHVSFEIDGPEVVATFPTQADLTRDTWEAIQFQIGFDTGTGGFVRAWLGETYLGEVTGLHTLPSADDILDNVTIGDYWNGRPFQNTDWYADEFIITLETPNTLDSGGRPYISPTTRASQV